MAEILGTNSQGRQVHCHNSLLILEVLGKPLMGEILNDFLYDSE